MALPVVNIDEIAIVVAALAVMVLGALWYSPLLFGRIWAKLSDINEKKMAAMKRGNVIRSYVFSCIGTILMLYVVAHFILYLDVEGIVESFQFAFWLWVGLVAPTHLGIVLWEGKPLALYLLNTGYYLVALLIGSSILAAW